MNDVSPRTYVQLRCIATAGALWLTQRGLFAAVPAGTDVEAHVVRTDAALHLLAHGRLDGWFTTFGSGYRLSTVYGPGLALVVGLVKLLSFGALDTARSLGVVGVGAIAVLPWAVAALSRELGSTRLAAALHGSLALFVTFPYGGGLAGLYGTGLIPQTLALPVLFAALAGLLRVARTGERRAVALTGLTVGALLLLHPISLLILAVLAPPIVLLRGPREWRRIAQVAAAAVWGAAAVGFWLVPAWDARGLRGGVSSWQTIPLPSRLAQVMRGRVLLPQLVAVAGALALLLLVGEAVRSAEARRRLVAPVVALTYLVVAHLAAGHHLGPEELRIQFANRGLGLAMMLLLLPLAGLAGQLLGSPRLRAPQAPLAATVLLAIALPALLHGPLSPRQSAPPPSPDLAATGRTIHRVVAPWARDVVSTSPFVALGTDEPTRWLAATTGRNTAQLFFAEATRSQGAGNLPGRFPTTLLPADALGPLRRMGITHVVLTDPAPSSALAGHAGYRLVARHGTLAVWAVEAEPGEPPVATLLQPDGDGPRLVGFHLRATLRRHQAEDLAWTTRATSPVLVAAAVADDPGWHTFVDGRPVRTSRSADELVRFRIPAGAHQVELRFTGARNDVAGIAASCVAIVAMGWVLRPRRRRTG